MTPSGFKRLRVALGAVPFALLPVLVLPFVAVASVPSAVDHYSSAAKAAAIRVYGFDNTLQFATVDSSFPEALSGQAGQSGLGYSDASASYYDYGPAGVTVLGVPDGQGPPFNSLGLGPSTIPPASASYPSGRSESTLYPTQSNFGAPGPPPAQGPYATAEAHELDSEAFATYAGNVQSAFPLLTSQTTSTLGSDGTLRSTAHSYLAEATIGPFTFSKIDVTATVVSSGGSGRVEQSNVSIGSVEANGQAVSLTDQGLTIGPATTSQPLSLNGTASVGEVTYTAQLVSPVQTINGPDASLTAMGVKVVAVETPPTGDIFTEEYDLGFAGVDAAAVPAQSSSVGLNFSVPGGLGNLPGTGPLTAGSFPSTFQAPPKPPHPAAIPKLYLAASSRKPLAMAFLGWEALLMCGVAAWIWSRKLAGAPG